MKGLWFTIAFLLSTLIVTDALTLQRHEAGEQGVYVSFVSGPEYWKYAFVLTSTLRDLKNTHQHVYMVKEGSAEAHIAPKVEQHAAHLGLNIKILEFKPITVPWKTAYSFWDEAWQRVVLYKMNQFTRMLHLDADIVVFRNIEHILTQGAIPSVARRMGSCSKKEAVCTNTPVSNVMLIEPNATVAEKIDVYLREQRSGGDETVQFNFHSGLHRFSPEDAMYSDCFESLTSEQLEHWGLNASSRSRMPAVVHLGIPFKTYVGDRHFNSLEDAHAAVTSLRQSGKKFKAELVERWYGHFFSAGVQAMLALTEPSASRRSLRDRDGSLRLDDICD